MIEGRECDYCPENAVVPVLDKNIERSPKPGNKFRQCCMACGQWAQMTSEAHFRGHDHPHVLPLGESERDGLVRLSEYDYGPEWDDLVDKVSDEPDAEPEHPENRGKALATDGGVDEPEPEPEPENSFVCPMDGCEAEHTGYPDECGSCGAAYQWSDQNE